MCTTWLRLFLSEPNKNCDQSLSIIYEYTFESNATIYTCKYSIYLWQASKYVYILPVVVTLSVVGLCPVPPLLLPKHVYVPASLCWTLKMVRDGLEVVLPLYLLVLVLELMVVMVPPIFLCHCTLVIGRLDDTVHTKVTLFPVFTE